MGRTICLARAAASSVLAGSVHAMLQCTHVSHRHRAAGWQCCRACTLSTVPLPHRRRFRLPAHVPHLSKIPGLEPARWPVGFRINLETVILAPGSWPVQETNPRCILLLWKGRCAGFSLCASPPPPPPPPEGNLAGLNLKAEPRCCWAYWGI